MRTSGDERSRSPCDASSAGSDAGAPEAVAAAVAFEVVDGVEAAGAVAFAAPPPITATTVFICTVLPASTLIAESVPLAGEGISASTLSVEISNSGSSRWTLSPTFFSHLVIVPSKIDSPICGITTSVPPPLEATASTGAAGAGAALGAPRLLLFLAGSCFGGVAAGSALLATAPSPSPITATTVLICTVLPASTLISESVPLAGDGISASTLSVEISNSGSSRCTLSPGFFSHFVIVPSKIDSPIWGMMTSVGISTFRLPI